VYSFSLLRFFCIFLSHSHFKRDLSSTFDSSNEIFDHFSISNGMPSCLQIQYIHFNLNFNFLTFVRRLIHDCTLDSHEISIFFFLFHLKKLLFTLFTQPQRNLHSFNKKNKCIHNTRHLNDISNAAKNI
jgi:hypothetical protein